MPFPCSVLSSARFIAFFLVLFFLFHVLFSFLHALCVRLAVFLLSLCIPSCPVYLKILYSLHILYSFLHVLIYLRSLRLKFFSFPQKNSYSFLFIFGYSVYDRLFFILNLLLSVLKPVVFSLLLISLHALFEVGNDNPYYFCGGSGTKQHFCVR